MHTDSYQSACSSKVRIGEINIDHSCILGSFSFGVIISAIVTTRATSISCIHWWIDTSCRVGTDDKSCIITHSIGNRSGYLTSDIVIDSGTGLRDDLAIGIDPKDGRIDEICDRHRPGRTIQSDLRTGRTGPIGRDEEIFDIDRRIAEGRRDSKLSKSDTDDGHTDDDGSGEGNERETR